MNNKLEGKMLKKSVALILVSLVLNTLSAPSSSAIFGLSKCEKVKKEILSTENKINSFIRNIRFIENDVVSEKTAYRITQFQKNSYIKDIWKISFNNPKCFTNSQKLQIEKLPKLSLSGYINFYDYGKHVQEGICKDVEFYFIAERCIKEHKYTVTNYFLYESLYSY